MLDSGSTDSVLNDLLSVICEVTEAVDKRAAEGVAAADTVNDIGDLVLTADVEVTVTESKNAGPVVVVSRDALTV